MSDWIEHDGSVMPKHAKPSDYVQVRFRDGLEQGDTFPMTVEWWGPLAGGAAPLGHWLWDDENTTPDYQIVAYRVVPL